jgi:hypothetical protein
MRRQLTPVHHANMKLLISNAPFGFAKPNYASHICDSVENLLTIVSERSFSVTL